MKSEVKSAWVGTVLAHPHETRRAAKLEQLRQDIREGFNSGEPTPWDPEKIKREGRKRRAGKANQSIEA